MPICPGCEQRVAHRSLDTHERYCDGLQDADDTGRRTVERLARRVEALEQRLDGQVEDGESAPDEPLLPVDRSSGGRLPSDRE